MLQPQPLQLFLPDEPLPDDAQVAYLVAKQPRQPVSHYMHYAACNCGSKKNAALPCSPLIPTPDSHLRRLTHFLICFYY